MPKDEQILSWIEAYTEAHGKPPGVHKLRSVFGIGAYRAERLLRLYQQGSQAQPYEFLKENHINPHDYEVERILINKWGKPGQESHQIKVWLSPEKSESELAELLKQRLSEHPKVEVISAEQTSSALAVISIPDIHVGMLAWKQEVGENYDTKIALSGFHRATKSLLESIKRIGIPIERIVFPIGNDLLHSDTHENTTTAGTRLDVDSRWQKAFLAVAESLIVGPLSWASEIAPLHIVVVPGNHDYQRAFYLGEVIRWYFRGKNSDVVVDNSPRLRKYITWQNVLLGFTHGSWVKTKDLPMIMAQEVPEEWGRTRWREWLLGHYHRKREMAWNAVEEVSGVRVRILPSLAPADEWHYRNGFIGGQREATATLYGANGPIADLYYRPEI